jgi:4-amino-4-deoxy-L-arabinose transferase-like glycosyltransferase
VLPRSRWSARLAAVALLGLAVRVGWVLLATGHDVDFGDAFYYHYGANLLADGEGYLDPFQRLLFGRTVAAADHPPGYLTVLALPSLLGLDSVLAHQLASCLLGAATIVVVGTVGRRLAGDGAGLLAAALAGGYPNFWLHDGRLLSETLAQLTAAVVLLTAYRLWDRPGVGRAAALGVAGAAAALTRAELVLLLGLALLPLLRRDPPWRQRLVPAAVALAAAAAVLAPWVGHNLSRFDRPVLISGQLDISLAYTNCDPAYRGPLKGYWVFECARAPDPPQEPSVVAAGYRRAAVEYAANHTRELPGVVAARVGRSWGLFRPVQQVRLDTLTRAEEVAGYVGLAAYYLLLPPAVAGAVLLRRRRVPLLPLLALPVTVTAASALVNGSIRFRAPAEVTLVLLAAAALTAVPVRTRAPAPGA